MTSLTIVLAGISEGVDAEGPARQNRTAAACSENSLLLGSIRTMSGFGWFRIVPEFEYGLSNPRRVGEACGVVTVIDRSD